MKQRYIYVVLFFWTLSNVYGQQFNYFNILPDVGAVNGQSRFRGVHADSNYIYVIGDMVSKQDSDGRNKIIDPMAWVFDYSGILVSSNKIVDSLIPVLQPFGEVVTLYPQENGTFDFMFGAIPFEGEPNGTGGYARVNMHTGKILKTCKMPFHYLENSRIGDIILNEITWVNDRLVWAQLTSGPGVREQRIMEMDTSFTIVKIVLLEDKLTDTLENHCWVNKDKYGNYEIVSDVSYFKNNSPTGNVGLIYKKYDSAGILIKKQILNTGGKIIGINGNLVYNVKRDLEGKFMVLGNERDPVIASKNYIPIALFTSPEFDTLYKLTPMYPYSLSGEKKVDHWTNYLEMLGDDRGFIANAEIWTSLFAEPDYGVLYKVSAIGDSIWTRKYQPMGWDSARAAWIKFIQVKETPYQSLVVSAYLCDGDENVVRAWLLHLDKDGCLVPGCGISNNNNQENSIESLGFDIHPNPITSNYLYMLSHITQSRCRLSLCDMSGNVLLSRYQVIEKDVQYLIDVPSTIVNGQYFLKLEVQGRVFTRQFQILR